MLAARIVILVARVVILVMVARMLLPLLKNSTEYLEPSAPSCSCCCFRISSISRELFLLNTPEKEREKDVRGMMERDRESNGKGKMAEK